jgi:hypothetical protein
MKSIRTALKIKPKPRLLRALARHLENNVQDDEFYMAEWCGTERCAMGHAPSVPAIRKQGLRIVTPKYFGPYLTLRKADEDAMANLRDGNAAGNFERAQFVFGITAKESIRAFDNSVSVGHMTRAAVARRLRKIAAKYDGKPV